VVVAPAVVLVAGVLVVAAGVLTDGVPVVAAGVLPAGVAVVTVTVETLGGAGLADAPPSETSSVITLLAAALLLAAGFCATTEPAGAGPRTVTVRTVKPCPRRALAAAGPRWPTTLGTTTVDAAGVAGTVVVAVGVVRFTTTVVVGEVADL